MIQTDILIQNVSEQCIPNLSAVYAFRPDTVIWVYTEQVKPVFERLRRMCTPLVQRQHGWKVDARDTESMHAALLQRFTALGAPGGKVVYHLTGGTKSMSLQGLYNLGNYRRQCDADVLGVVLDHVSGCFDVIYPQARNNALPNAILSLDQMLEAHGNRLDPDHAPVLLSTCADQRKLWEGFHDLSEKLKASVNFSLFRALHRRPAKGNMRHFKGSEPLPKALHRMLSLLQEGGIIRNLSFPASNEMRYEQGRDDVLKLLNGGWLERWLGAVLQHPGMDWQGAMISAKVLQGEGGGSQEFDFLGASRNRIIYFSCKTDKELRNDKLFEVDALRDGIAGRDYHVAGLLHTANVTDVMRRKARRMGVGMIHALHDDSDDCIRALCR